MASLSKHAQVCLMVEQVANICPPGDSDVESKTSRISSGKEFNLTLSLLEQPTRNGPFSRAAKSGQIIEAHILKPTHPLSPFPAKLPGGKLTSVFDLGSVWRTTTKSHIMYNSCA